MQCGFLFGENKCRWSMPGFCPCAMKPCLAMPSHYFMQAMWLWHIYFSNEKYNCPYLNRIYIHILVKAFTL